MFRKQSVMPSSNEQQKAQELREVSSSYVKYEPSEYVSEKVKNSKAEYRKTPFLVFLKPSVERRFLEWYYSDNYRRLKVMSLLMLCMQFICLFAYDITSPKYKIALSLRASTAAVGVLCLVTVIIPKKFFPTTLKEISMCIQCFLTIGSFGILENMHIGSVHSVDREPRELLICSVVILVSVRTRLFIIAPTCFVASLGLYIAGYFIFRPDHGISAFCGYVVVLVVMNILSTVALYEIERLLRNMFVKIDILQQQDKSLDQEKKRTEELMLNILPSTVCESMKSKSLHDIADFYDSCSVLFSDIVGFTFWTSHTSADIVVTALNNLFSHFDNSAEELGVEKIKTIGDAYFCICYLQDNAKRIAIMATSMINAIEENNKKMELQLKMRIGIDQGSVLAGIIGTNQISYEVFGDCVEMSHYLESTSLPGQIQVSKSVYESIRDKFRCLKREPSITNPKGEAMVTFFLQGLKDTIPISTAYSPVIAASENIPDDEFLTIPNSVESPTDNDFLLKTITTKIEQVEKKKEKEVEFQIDFHDKGQEKAFQLYLHGKTKKILFVALAVTFISLGAFFGLEMVQLGVAKHKTVFYNYSMILQYILLGVVLGLCILTAAAVRWALVTRINSTLVILSTWLYMLFYALMPEDNPRVAVFFTVIALISIFMNLTMWVKFMTMIGTALVFALGLIINKKNRSYDYMIFFESGLTVMLLLMSNYLIDNSFRKSYTLDMQISQKIGLNKIQKEKSEKLLLSVIPKPIFQRLEKNPSHENIIDHIPSATVVFLSVVDFEVYLEHALASQNSNKRVVLDILSTLFESFDQMLGEFHTDKIKSIGSVYMCVTNLFNNAPDHQKQATLLALSMMNHLKENHPDLACTIGIHCGPMIAAVLGKKKYRYDVVSDTVNTASRMCTTAESNGIQCSEQVYEALSKTNEFRILERGYVEMKGKGRMRTFQVLGQSDLILEKAE